MSGQRMMCRVDTCPAFEDLVGLFLVDQNRWIVDEYAALLEDDPEYLQFHWLSAAMKLQYQFKSSSLPDLDIGGCIDATSQGCCVVDALKEAIVRKGSADGGQAEG